MDRRCGIYPDLIKQTSNCLRPADFSNVLARLAEFAGAIGCRIWEKFYAGTEARRYFKLAGSFPGEIEQQAWHFLPQKSVTGVAIESQIRQVVPDVEQAIADGRIVEGHLLQSCGIKAFCAIPISFGERREAAVNFYWNHQNIPGEEELDAISQAASVVPELMHSLLNKVGFELLQKVERNLNEAPPEVPSTEVHILLQSVLEAIADTFNAKECSIFLEDRAAEPGIYRRRAAIWPWRSFTQAECYQTNGHGLTPWVIRHSRSLRFVDLSHFEEERTALKANSPAKPGIDSIFDDLDWPTEGALLHEVLPDRGSANEAQIQPISFLCVPIRDGERVTGAIRCCGTSRAPFLFDERHIQILELVAEQIGHWWSSRLALQEERAETSRFKELVSGISAMHEIVAKSLTDREKPKMASLWNRALDLLAVVSPWPEAMSIRLVEGDGQALTYVAHYGQKWDRSHLKASAMLATTYRLDEDWAGSRAVKELRVLKEENPGRPGALRSYLFPEAKRLLHAPIISGKQAIGVIDIRGFDDRPLPPHLELLCELIGRQLGLYHYLQETFWNLKSREVDLFKQQEDHQQTYEDFVHQLRNPLVKAGTLAERITNRNLPELNQLRTYLRHANLFADTINNFVSLAKGTKLDTDFEVMLADELVAMLVQMGEDQETALMGKRDLRFAVDAPSFEILHRMTIYYSKYLFLHCMFNLLDNASKYSKTNSEVVIRARFDEEKGRFVISVINQVLPYGHRIEAADRKRLVKRGERGERAMMTTAGGRGIGLWIVQKFMEAMGGDLIILPTDSRDRNTFSLSFRKTSPKGATTPP